MTIKFQTLFEGSSSNEILNTRFEPLNIYSFIREDIAEKIGMMERLPNPRAFHIEPFNLQLNAEKAICLTFTMNNLRLSDEFMIIRDLPEEIIIGDTTIRKWRMKLDFDNNTVHIDPRVAEFMLKRAV